MRWTGIRAMTGALAVLSGLAPTQAVWGQERKPVEKQDVDRRGCAFIGVRDCTSFERTLGGAPGETVLTSPEMPTGLPADEIVVSWNADAPVGTGLKMEARATCGDRVTKWYVLGLWSKDGKAYPRESVNDQKDADGNVQTDTLVLTRPAQRVTLRVTLHRAENRAEPRLKFLGVSLKDTHAKPAPLEPNRAVWGREIVVPGRTQLGWKDASGWCSPTSTDMTLAFWAKKLNRPELDISVPDAAHAIYDRVYDGTGNWPFNTAFAGSFPGMRAYVTRLSDIRELEDWIAVGIPPVVSVSYDLLKGMQRDSDPGHLMVCDGFTKEGDIVLNDPAHHPDRGQVARAVFPRANFLRAWQRSKNLIYLIYPENATGPADPYGHWDSAP